MGKKQRISLLLIEIRSGWRGGRGTSCVYSGPILGVGIDVRVEVAEIAVLVVEGCG